MEDNRTLLLSALELNLCARLLGEEDWDDIPVPRTEAALEQDLLEAFAHLTAMGLLVHEGGHFVCTAELKERMACVLTPERMLLRESPHTPVLRLYGRGTRMTAVEELFPGAQRYRVEELSAEEQETCLLRGLREPDSVPEELSIQVWSGEKALRLGLLSTGKGWRLNTPRGWTAFGDENALEQAVWEAQ